MKNLTRVFRQEANKYKPKCNPKPGEWNSCDKCKDCNKKRRFPAEEEGPTVCCGIIDPVPHFPNVNQFDIAQTEQFQFSMDCPILLAITFQALNPLGGFGGIILDIIVNGSSINTFDQGNGDISTFTASISPGDSMYMNLYNINSYNSSVHVSMFNQTCQIDYGLVIDLYKVKYGN